MASGKKTGKLNRIPIKFSDSDVSDISNGTEADELTPAPDEQDAPAQADNGEELSAFEDSDDVHTIELNDYAEELQDFADVTASPAAGEAGGPAVAELVATRAELKRVEGEVTDLKDRLARRQADFENYRKRGERERGETYERVVAEIAAKLLPVLDNLKRALDTEASLEAGESDEFRHFLSGVDLIFKQLGGVIEALGVTPVLAVGAPFDPHIHEAVVSEATDEHEPDTVMEEIIRGYRLGDKLIRPALVKVATKK